MLYLQNKRELNDRDNSKIALGASYSCGSVQRHHITPQFTVVASVAPQWVGSGTPQHTMTKHSYRNVQ